MGDFDDVISAALADTDALEKRAKLDLKDEDLLSLAKLADEQVRLEDLVEELSEILSAANKALLEVSQNLLPDAMEKGGIKSFELADGSKLSVSKKYIGSITKENEDSALEWFKATKRSGVITPNVTMPFGKGMLESAEDAVRRVESLGLPVQIKPSVHWQTLRAVVRELYENGEPVPECISTHIINEAKIKRK